MTDGSVAGSLIERLRDARVYDLGMPFSPDMPAAPSQPVTHSMQRLHGDAPRPGGADSATDILTMFLHNGTHVDAIGHFSRDGMLHGNRKASEHQVGGRGLTSLGVEELEPTICRGVMLDIAAAEGVDRLPREFGVSAQHIEDVSRSQDTPIDAGDAVLVRTGYITLWDRPGEFMRSGRSLAQPGLTADAGEYLAAKGVCLVGADTPVVEQVAAVAEPLMAVHMILLVDHGIPLLEMVNLEPLARERVYEFAFMMAPLPLVGATASPVRPLALVERR